MSYRELPESTSDLEQEILERWEEEDTFRESLREREGDPEYVFYEGPPTANGRPGVHHILARTIKDLVARYWTMRGRHVTRIAGWDTHGLPVEVEAEKELGISGKPEIEEIGIERFVQTCRENLFTYQEEWEDLSRRIGYWLDYDDPYVTYHPDYIESVWWAVKQIHDEGLLYQGYKSLPYCPRCGTGLSSHELAQGYEQRRDPSLFSLFPVVSGDGGGDAPRRHLLVWTTTPWTLVSNVAVAFNPELAYVEVEALLGRSGERGRVGEEGGARTARVLLSRGRAEDLFRLEGSDGSGDGEGGSPERPRGRIVREVPSGELEGLEYRRPLHLYPGYREESGRLHPAEFVSDEEGTGLVHIAPAFGADDFELGKERDLPLVRPVDDDGRFVPEVEEVGGLPVKEADDRLVELLAEEGLLFRRDTVLHSYPHCWRCDTPLLYMAQESWYVETTAVKERLLEENASVEWHPPEVGSGRMGEWLENNVDWALSRDRFWGTPLPVWVCDADEGHREVIGSFDRLSDRAGGLPEDFDPHRPEIDRVQWSCDEDDCEGTMTRVPQVMDAWFDSGSMPFAQWHYPFEGEEEFRRHFPADIIAEGVDQTRGWFYSLLAISTIVFDRSPYREVVVNDLVLDAEGRKMSKSRGNTVDPWSAIERHGADAIRLYLITSSNPWLPKRWDPEGLEEIQRKLLDTLRNTYRFFAMYANLEDWHHGGGDARWGEPRPPSERPVMDRWLLSRLDTVAARTRQDLEENELTRAARRLDDFVVDELSNWYVRRTRDRFWVTGSSSDGELRPAEAFDTLHRALRTTSLLLAPVAPFISDWLHRELSIGDSVHLADFPEPSGHRRPDLEEAMEDVRELAALGRAAREELGVKVRQPLRRVEVVIPGGRTLPDSLVRVLKEELNVKRVAFPSETADIVRLHARPDYSELGPRFGSRTPAVAEAVEELEGSDARRLREGESIELVVDGEPAEIRPRDVQVLESGRGEYAVRSERGYMVALDPSLDAELRAEGLAREVVSRVQRFRRDAGLDVDDRIRLVVAGDEEVEAAVRAHREYVAGETLALELEVGQAADGRDHVTELNVDDHPLRLGLEPFDEEEAQPTG
ncbi:MAG: isoleucine--tRNA ligase [Candidatus Palauibacterales bacterium]|nr:isoleucine--tRNA ligase [Candidatus Palauibacterales bacterium]